MKVLLSLDEALLRQIDRAARQHRLSRSGFIAQLAHRALGTQKGPGATPAARSALARLDRIFAGAPVADDPTEAVRRERDERAARRRGA